MLPLNDILVVTVEQAVAAPLCTARLREAGARVIKIERPEGDFARGYDSVAGGDSSYFLWANQGKESLVLNIKDPSDAALLHRILAQTDIFVQNLAPNALRRAGFGSTELRKRHSRLITCDISGYGKNPAVSHLKAYDFLVQAESGLISISGAQSELGRVGISICDIGAGMNAHAGLLEALIARGKTGNGSGIEVSLFGVAADWMTVPLLHHDYGGKAPSRAGLHHPSIAPYGAYQTKDNEIIIVVVQNEREWPRFCRHFLGQPDIATDALFDSNHQRVKNRSALDTLILKVTQSLSRSDVIARLKRADIAYGSLNSVADFSEHPALERRTGVSSQNHPVRYPIRPISATFLEAVQPDPALRVPTLGEHSTSIRKEFPTV